MSIFLQQYIWVHDNYHHILSLVILFNLSQNHDLLSWYLHLVMVGEPEYSNNQESYAADSGATGRATLGRQVEGLGSH